MTYWIYPEITADKIRNKKIDYSVESFICDFRKELKYIYSEKYFPGITKKERNFNISSILDLAYQAGPLMKNATQIGKEINVPEQKIKKIINIFWTEIQIFFTITDRDFKKMKSEMNNNCYDDLTIYLQRIQQQIQDIT